MKVENGKIVEITEAELFGLYLERNMDDIMDFNEYRFRMERTGCVVKERRLMTNRDQVLNDRHTATILAMAELNMNQAEVGRMLHFHRNAIVYHCEVIEKRTGLDPRRFYDLIKLVEMVKEGDTNG